MRSLSGSPHPVFPALDPLALILAAVAPVVWGVAGLALGLTLLVWGAWSWCRSFLPAGPGPTGAGGGCAGPRGSWSRGPGSAGAGSAGPGCAGGGSAKSRKPRR
jgi:hypothetical protein